MLPYMKARGFNSVDDVIDGCYEKVYLSGYNIFKTMVVTYYNQYVDIAQTITVPVLRRNEYIGKQIIRTPVDMIEFQQEYGEKWFLNLYITIRNYEEDNMFTAEKVKLMTDRAWEMLRINGVENALGYVNLQLSDLTQRAGSVSEQWHRRQQEENKEKELQNRKKPGTIG